MHRPLTASLCLTAFVAAGSAVAAQNADAAGKAFADHCFSPYLTAATAQANLAPSGARFDFYDLRPFSSAAPSPVTGRAATAGTDRRCEVAFDGYDPALAFNWLEKGLIEEGLLNKKAQVPDGFTPQDGTSFIAAAQLNPNRIAVVQIGVRGPANAPETFMSVERLTPLNEEGSQ
ncbi:succinyl-CoA synthetase subunit beta [uncultured Sulfitobacter sp.]|uniref:succinyl-CoA synthetase subunit beta n=1 Tax=uncultured Sulfitobacter sp. TaxID=191468 RepID=UPI002621E864|nr:succinyl-CoA synthetase subunit beta [uncultured Sulfitobacter sp.]